MLLKLIKGWNDETVMSRLEHYLGGKGLQWFQSQVIKVTINSTVFNPMKHTYRWTSLYAIDRDSKNRLAYNKFAYKETKDDW